MVTLVGLFVVLVFAAFLEVVEPREVLEQVLLWSEGLRGGGVCQAGLFRDVGVDAQYAYYEANAYARINAFTDAVPELMSPCGDAVLRRSVFRVYLDKIYKRTK